MPDENTFDHELDDIAAVLRTLDDDDLTLIQPPADLWGGIADAIGDETADSEPGAGESAVVSLASRRQRRGITQRSLLMVAAAAVVVVAGVAALAMQRDATTVVATAELSYDPVAFDPLGADASATVELVEEGDGFTIAFDEARLPDELSEDADLELWLIAPDSEGGVADLVSLGRIDATDHGYAVPAGYDPDRFSVVDISVEPRDGDDQHSGRSILRGPLSA